MHPDTPDDQVAVLSEKFGEMMKSKPVDRLISKLGEDIIFVPHDKAGGAYQDVLSDAKKYLPMFQ